MTEDLEGCAGHLMETLSSPDTTMDLSESGLFRFGLPPSCNVTRHGNIKFGKFVF